MEHLKYPIGKFDQLWHDKPLKDSIEIIELFPTKLNDLTLNATKEQLQSPYRPQGWTVAQVVHHCADSHMNAFVRVKLALTEDKPTIMPYEEQL